MVHSLDRLQMNGTYGTYGTYGTIHWETMMAGADAIPDAIRISAIKVYSQTRIALRRG